MQTNQHNPQSHLHKVVYIGISFMVLFSAYNIAKNLISYIYKDLGYTNLGRICIFALYVSFAIGNIFAPHFERKFSTKVNLVTGSITYLLFELGGTLTSYCNKYDLHNLLCSDASVYLLNLIFACLIGLGAALLWLAQSNYVNNCTNETNKGTYHGIFNSLMQSSMLIGSIIAAFVLGYTDWYIFYLILTLLSVIAIVMFLFLPPLDKKQNESQGRKSVASSTKAFFACYKHLRYYPIIIISFMSGVIVAFYATYYPTIVQETLASEIPNIVNQRVSFGFICLGLGQTIAGYMVGRLIDKFPNVRISDYIFGNIELMFVISYLAIMSQSYTLALTAGFLCGTGDNGTKTLSISLISTKFNGKSELFATYRATQSFGILFGTLCAILFSDKFGKLFVLGMLMLQIICHIIFNLTFAKIIPKEKDVELAEKLVSS